MIETIAVVRMLREAVASPYPNLVTRPTGAAVRARIEDTLARCEAHTALLDFSEVAFLDLSCADEIVAKLVRGGRARCVALRGLHEDLWEPVHEVLQHQHLAVLVVDDRTGAALLGAVTDDLRDAFRHLADHGPADAALLGQALGWSEERAQQTLDTLVALRVARHGADGRTRLPLPQTAA